MSSSSAVSARVGLRTGCQFVILTAPAQWCVTTHAGSRGRRRM
jgi:hypothetical protein